MNQFWCQGCQILFSGTGRRIDWHSKVYGHCHRWVATCPKCKKEVDEYQPMKRLKKVNDSSLSNFSCACGGGVKS